MKIFKIQVTDRKKQVAKLYVEGKTFEQIGRILDPPVSNVRAFKMWNDMIKYCINLNRWPDSVLLLNKKDFLNKYGKAMISTLRIR